MILHGLFYNFKVKQSEKDIHLLFLFSQCFPEDKIYLKSKVIWDKVFKNGPSKLCGRQPLKKMKGYGLPKADISLWYELDLW